MRLVMTLLVRDDADIVATMLDYHLAQGVDHVVAMDNGSTDGTLDVLRTYAAGGVLTLIDGGREPFDQPRLVTRLARLAASEHGADWVLNADADEFFHPRLGTLPDAFAAVPESAGALVVPRNDFLPVAGDGPFWERMVVREAVSVSPTGFRLLPKLAHRGSAEVQVADGNHGATGPGLDRAPFVRAIEVLHFPFRTLEQAAAKVRRQAGRRRSSGVYREGDSADHILLADHLERGTFAAWFAARSVAWPRTVADSGGALVLDTRVRDVLRAGTERRPRDPAATAVLADEFHEAGLAAVALERRSAAATDLAASLETRLRAATAALEATEASLASERAEHYETAEALRLLRDSRAVRMARAVRRVGRRPA